MKEKPLHLKRAVFAVLFTLLLSVAGVTNATAQSFTVGDLTYSFNDDGASVTLTGHVDGISGQLVIPESVELYGTTYPVTAIGNNAFQYCYDLTGDLVIPNSVITIGGRAFYYCSGLNGSLTIGDAVQTIGYTAFYYCNFTGTLTIPESMTYIEYYAFVGCDFAKLNYNATNCGVDYEWLEGCDLLGTLAIGENVQVIPNGFLYQRSSFTGGLVIPNSVTTIGSSAFAGCTGFPGALNIPNSVTSIGENAFYGCSGFTGSLNIPNSVNTISNSAFYGCSGFTGSLNIGNAVTTIGENAFNGCSGFTGSLTIPNSVTTIGSSAFLNCSGFSGTLTLGNSLTQINNSAFFGACESFTSFNVLAETPPALGNYVFLSVNTEIPVYVTCGTLEAYQNASGWSNFTNLQENNPCMWEITVSTNPAEGGTANGAGVYEQGQTCTLTATPNEDYAFVNWTENGAEVSTEASYSFTVEGNRNLVANFRSIRYNVWVDIRPAEGGTVSASNRDRGGWLHYDNGSYASGIGVGGGTIYWGVMFPSNMITETSLAKVALYENGNNTEPITIYIYSGGTNAPGTLLYSETVNPVGGNAFHEILLTSPVTIDPSQNLWVVFSEYGTYPANGCNDTGNANGRWVSTDGIEWADVANYGLYYTWMIRAYIGSSIGSYLEGETCTLTATPNGDYEFSRWTENGIEVSTDAVYSFTVEGNRDLVAHFTNPNFIVFADPDVEAICVNNWDTDGDGFLSYAEAAAVTDLGWVFEYNGNVNSFDELQYFTGLTSIRYESFYDCGNLTSITLPENITSIGSYAFGECYNLSSINVLAVTPPSAGYSSFSYLNIDNIIVSVPCNTMNDYQNADGWYRFTNYQEPEDCIYEIMATVNIEEAGTVSGAGSYQKGSICTLVATPNEGRSFVRWVENGQEVSTETTYSFTVTGPRDLVAAFMALEEDIIVFADPDTKYVCVNNWDTDGDGELTYDEAAAVTDLWGFYDNYDINSFDELQYFTGLSYIGDWTFEYCYYLSSIIIPNTVTSIGSYAFQHCGSLSSIVLPNSLTSIGDGAFLECYSLNSIAFPESLVSIGNEAFHNCNGLRGELTLPESIDWVGEYAFANCDEITTITFNAVNCYVMGNSQHPVFYDCLSVEHIHIGENVESIPNYAFKRCSNVADIHVDAMTPPTVGISAFATISHSVPVYVPCGTSEDYQTASGWNEFMHILEDCSQMQTQTIALTAGWNWFSTYIEADDLLQQLEASLGENGLYIESSELLSTEYLDGEWLGDLEEVGITNEQMYLIQTSAACTIQLQGLKAHPANHVITINPEWNWVGYLCSEEMTIAEALAGFVPEDGDQIESMEGYAEYLDGEWLGLETLKPGEGFLYYSNSATTKTFVFPASAK